jgi:ABC-2 type transport system permease protein
LIAFVVLLLVLVAYFGALDVQNRQQLVSESRKEVRLQWENMGPSNPHSAAHYGSYAFKPISPLTALDEGVNLTAGRVLRLEGHVQNETVHSSQSQSVFISYFGPLKASLILQIMIPLLIIFLTYYSIQSEREQGRIRLILVQGLSYRSVVLGKVISVWILSIVVLLATLVVQWIIFGDLFNGDYLLRSALLVLSYSSFYFIISAITAGFCSSVAKGSSALTVMLAVWVLW